MTLSRRPVATRSLTLTQRAQMIRNQERRRLQMLRTGFSLADLRRAGFVEGFTAAAEVCELERERALMTPFDPIEEARMRQAAIRRWLRTLDENDRHRAWMLRQLVEVEGIKSVQAAMGRHFDAR